MADDNDEAGSTGKLAPKPPSRRDHPRDMYGISRKSPDATGQQAWTVRLSRGGRMIQISFSDSTYGGTAGALFVARAYRHAVLEIVPPLTRSEMRHVTRKKPLPSTTPRSQASIMPRPQETALPPGSPAASPSIAWAMISPSKLSKTPASTCSKHSKMEITPRSEAGLRKCSTED